MDELYRALAAYCTTEHVTTAAGTIWVPERALIVNRVYKSLGIGEERPTDGDEWDDGEFDACAEARIVCSLDWSLGGAPISWTNTISLFDAGDIGWIVLYHIDETPTTVAARLVGDHRALLNLFITELIANDGYPYVWYGNEHWQDDGDGPVGDNDGGHEILFADSPPDGISIKRNLLDVAAIHAGFEQRIATAPELWPKIAEIVDILENPGSFRLWTPSSEPQIPRTVTEDERPALLQRYIQLVVT